MSAGTYTMISHAASFVAAPGDMDSTTAWIGIGLNIFGCSVGCLGWLMQKYAHNDNEKEEKEEKKMKSDKASSSSEEKAGAMDKAKEKAEEMKDVLKSKRVKCCSCCPDFFSNPLWLFGLMIFIAGQLITALSLGLAPQTIVSTLNCWTIVITFCVAPFFLGEIVIVWRLLCVLFMCFGCMLVMVNGPHQYSEFTVEKLRSSLSNPVTFGMIMFIIGGSVGMFAYMKIKKVPESVPQLCFYAAATSWFSVLSTKVFMSLLATMAMEGSFIQLDHPDFFIALALVVVLAPSNVILMNKALQVGDATIVVPTYDAMAMCGQILLGGIFFEEFQEMDNTQLGGFSLGVATVLIGVFYISQEPPNHEFLRKVVIGEEKKAKRMAKSEASSEPSAASDAKVPLKEAMAAAA